MRLDGGVGRYLTAENAESAEISSSEVSRPASYVKGQGVSRRCRFTTEITENTEKEIRNAVRSVLSEVEFVSGGDGCAYLS
jgi:hypothetical protein